MLRHTRLYRGGRTGGAAAAAALALLSASGDALAQTWSAGRTTPSGQELVAVDATGELLWPHGYEDVAGDDDTFEPAEQSIDVRTAYVDADGQRFWARIHVSSEGPPAPGMIGFVFVDGDDDPSTGGTAAATAVHPGLATDPTTGGWDAVLVVPASGSPPSVWTWNQPGQWEQASAEPADITSEAGADEDPIGIGLGDTRGYLQASAVHRLLGVDETCAARLLVRSVVDTGGGDVDVDEPIACVPPDADGDGVPDLAVPPGCDADDDCPFDGVCVDGRCRLTELCDDAADCDANEDCSADGRCVARPGGTCDDDPACDTLLCVDGTCAACTPGGGECGAGRRCGADGRCVDGTDPGTGAGAGSGGGGVGLAPGEEVQGGACTCDVVGGSRPASVAAVLAVGALALGLVGRRRWRSGGGR